MLLQLTGGIAGGFNQAGRHLRAGLLEGSKHRLASIWSHAEWRGEVPESTRFEGTLATETVERAHFRNVAHYIYHVCTIPYLLFLAVPRVEEGIRCLILVVLNQGGGLGFIPAPVVHMTTRGAAAVFLWPIGVFSHEDPPPFCSPLFWAGIAIQP